MKYQLTIKYLNSFINHELYLDQKTPKNFSLDNMKKLLKALNHPEKDLWVVHIAGSKGKGSTAAMTASILKEAGFSVGLYTSPHIHDVRERIRVLDKVQRTRQTQDLFQDQISKRTCSQLVETLKPTLEKLRKQRKDKPLSYFEVLTALALCYFQNKKTNIVILETGLGGRLDATNAVLSKLCAITPISLEHTQLLGKTLTAIATEKAAIVKTKNQKVIISEQKKVAENVICKRCKDFNIQPVIVGKDIQYKSVSQNTDGQVFNVSSEKCYENISTPLLGKHQIINAATAIGIIESLRRQKFKIADDFIYKGFKNVFWPGRMEVLKSKVVTVLDSAHNQSSAHFMVGCLKMMFPKGNVTFVLGISRDKDFFGMCNEIKDIAGKVIATQAKHSRAYGFSGGELEKVFSKGKCSYTKNVKEAVELAYAETPKGGAVVVTGSVFVVAEARGLLKDYLRIKGLKD